MIISNKNFEYSGVVSDVITTLGWLETNDKPYVLKIWVDGTEIPFTTTDDDTTIFLEESIKISYANGKKIDWILYGIIMTFEVIK